MLTKQRALWSWNTEVYYLDILWSHMPLERCAQLHNAIVFWPKKIIVLQLQCSFCISRKILDWGIRCAAKTMRYYWWLSKTITGGTVLYFVKKMQNRNKHCLQNVLTFSFSFPVGGIKTLVKSCGCYLKAGQIFSKSKICSVGEHETDIL